MAFTTNLCLWNILILEDDVYFSLGMGLQVAFHHSWCVLVGPEHAGRVLRAVGVPDADTQVCGVCHVRRALFFTKRGQTNDPGDGNCSKQEGNCNTEIG